MEISFIVYGLKSGEEPAAMLSRFQHLRGAGGELIAILPHDDTTASAATKTTADKVVAMHESVAATLNTAATAAAGDILVFVHAGSILPDDARSLITQSLTPGNRVWGRFDIRYMGSRRSLRIIERLSNLWSRQSGSGSLAHGIFTTRLAYELAGRFSALPVFTDLAFCRALKQLSRPACIRTPVIRSSAPLESRGLWKTVLLTTWLNLSYRIGVDPGLLHLLAQRYQTLDAVAALEQPCVSTPS